MWILRVIFFFCKLNFAYYIQDRMLNSWMTKYLKIGYLLFDYYNGCD